MTDLQGKGRPGACVSAANNTLYLMPRTFGAMRFTPDGKAVLYTSDLTAYSNMYLVEVGEFDELPDLKW